MSESTTNEDLLADAARKAAAGDRASAQVVVEGITDRIYDLALRFLGHPADAEDATQEVLLVVLTHLGTFRGESAFSTWVWRIAANHLGRVRRGRREAMTFELLEERLTTGLREVASERPDPEASAMAGELRLRCTEAMLLALDRELRIAHILGDIFALPGDTCASILEIEPATFRKRVVRARAKLAEFMDGWCGVRDAANPCRCARQVDAMAERNLLDPADLDLSRRRRSAVAQAATEVRGAPRRGGSLAWRRVLCRAAGADRTRARAARAGSARAARPLSGVLFPQEESMETMRAIVIARPGAPEVLEERRRPAPRADEDTVVVRVRAFGLNHAETYFRRGVWGDAAKVTGIECAGEVHDPGASGLARGTRVFALMGGMGRTRDGSYAELVKVPTVNVVPFESGAEWTRLAAIPESYATAYTFLTHNLELAAGDALVVRGGTSALGQACIQLARSRGVHVWATTRSAEKRSLLERLGAVPLVDRGELAAEVRTQAPRGVDGVVDIVGTSTLVDSMKMVRYRGRVALAGFLGGGAPLTLDPLKEMPSGAQLSFFASAFMFGGTDVPLSAIPFAELVRQSDAGTLDTRPAHVFRFEEIVAAHRLMESGEARGKIVVLGP